ncbi:secretion-regulating guanine nucleotide exchange factor isoform X1 [Crotalus tigris]|uniref:secretion-regulating guanine nucleotide exchange factor isoform X1 n=1 Tax=Crotalus tigris TaxID=88082 RepID=UPI00192F7E2F|nr:secretion-regulating guanine nucleotide exchange factor isoform X1 [Crotalus tigris]
MGNDHCTGCSPPPLYLPGWLGRQTSSLRFEYIVKLLARKQLQREAGKGGPIGLHQRFRKWVPPSSATTMAVARQDDTRALLAWGANSYGQLGLGHKNDLLLPKAVKSFIFNQNCIKSITGGGGHSAILTDTGEIFFCGQNKDGQLGLGHTEDVTHFTLCSSLCGCPIVQVACGWDFTIVLAGNGQVFSCGSNSFGQLGIPDISGRCAIPAMIKSLQDKVINVAAGLRHAVAVIENGSVFQWGIGMASQAKRMCQEKNIPSFLRAKEPCKVPGFENVKVRSVASGSHHVVSLTDDGDLYVWGNNKHKQLLSKDSVVLEPQKIEAYYFEGEKIRRIWSGWTHLVVQSETEKVFTWGRGDYGQLGRSEMPCERESQDRKRSIEHHLKESSFAPATVPKLSGASEIACGSEHNLAIVGNQCFSWGWNEHGMCGNGTEENVCLLQPVGALCSAELLSIGCGAGHSLAFCGLPGLDVTL